MRSRLLRSAALVGLGVVAVTALAPTSARADGGTASTMSVVGRLDAAGALHVTETLAFSGGAPASLSQTLTTAVPLVHSKQQVYDVTAISAKVGNASVTPTVATADKTTTITLNTTGAGEKAIEISYTVTGATSSHGTDTVMSWPVLQGLSVGVRQITGSIKPPRGTTFVDCSAGPAGALGPCVAYGAGTFDSPDPSFTDGPRAAGDQVVLSFGVPAGSVAVTSRVHQLWTLDNAFSVTRNTLLAALVPLLLGALALWALHRRAGRDHAGYPTPTPVATFAPVGEGHSEFRLLDGVRPGEVGTVVDERVDPVDISATLLDLAVRGHLLIIEQPRVGPHAPLDWVFERRTNDADQLTDYEVALLDTVAPAGAGDVAVSGIGSAVRDVIPEVQSKLYDEVVRRGWFTQRPDSTRDRWTLIGWVALVVAAVAAGVLAAFTSYGLVGLALLVLAVGLVYVGQKMPRRTASGSSLLAGLSALAAQLQVQPTDQAAPGKQYSEPARVLPYAVVLGGTHRWLQAIADADDDPGVPDPTDLDWYHAPATWNLSDLPNSIEAFIVTVQGQLYRR